MSSSALATGRHAGPVWQVRWVALSRDRDEVLVSVGADGRVSQWSITRVRSVSSMA